MKTTLYIEFLLLLFISTIPPTNGQSQKLWSLSDCINYALKNNIDLEFKSNNIQEHEVVLQRSKTDIFPNLNFNTGLNINFGRNIDGETNDVTYNQTLSNSMWLSSSVDIFRGFIKKNTIQYNKYLLQASKEEKEVASNKLILDISSAYYTSIYSKDLLDLAKKQVELSKRQLERMQKIVDIGKESPLTVQELKSQWKADILNLTKASNQYDQSILVLKQLLRLNLYDTISLKINDEQFPKITSKKKDIDVIFTKSICHLPEIKQQELKLMASEKNLSIAKGRILPHIYMSAGIGSYYFDGAKPNYLNQIINNQNEQIRLGLVIPIFNGKSVQSDIKLKNIALKNQVLQIEKEKEKIYSEILRIYNNLKSSEEEFSASKELNQYNKLLLESSTNKMEKGLANTTEYEIAKLKYFSSKVNTIKAKLTYIMYYQLLEFYNTGNWRHLK